jgi:hypothetical protein
MPTEINLTMHKLTQFICTVMLPPGRTYDFKLVGPAKYIYQLPYRTIVMEVACSFRISMSVVGEV